MAVARTPVQERRAVRLASSTRVRGQERRPHKPPSRSVSSSSLLPKYEAARKPVEVRGDSVNYNMRLMEMGRFYFAELEGQPYLYRKVSNHEVEIYGLA
jgi:hypothetical protein